MPMAHVVTLAADVGEILGDPEERLGELGCCGTLRDSKQSIFQSGQKDTVFQQSFQ